IDPSSTRMSIGPAAGTAGPGITIAPLISRRFTCLAWSAAASLVCATGDVCITSATRAPVAANMRTWANLFMPSSLPQRVDEGRRSGPRRVSISSLPGRRDAAAVLNVLNEECIMALDRREFLLTAAALAAAPRPTFALPAADGEIFPPSVRADFPIASSQTYL